MPLTEAQKRAEKKRAQKITSFTLKYNVSESKSGKRLKKYLQDNGLTANSYLKSLVKADLDSKGIEFPSDDE